MSEGTQVKLRGGTIELADGRRLGFAEWGAPQGSPVFLMHGIPGSRLFRHPDDDLARQAGVRLVTVDRPGVGLSDPHPGHTLAGWGSDIGELADALKVGHFAVAGISGGGPYAMAVAHGNRARVTRMGPISSLGHFGVPAVRDRMREGTLADFITASRQAKYDAETDDLEELRNWHKKTGSNLLLAAAILSGGGGSGAADGQETVTGDSRSAGQSPSLTDASSRLARHSLGDGGNPIAGLRGGSAARFRLRSEAPARQAPIGKRVESPRIEENKAISSLPDEASAKSGHSAEDWSKFIPILPADVEAMLGQPARRSLGEVGSVTVFRSLGSKTDPVLHVRFPAPWSVVAESSFAQGASEDKNRRISNWRRGWDSNPRYP